MALFQTTRWSLLRRAADPAPGRADAALAELCTAYRPPVLAYVRQRGHGREEAEDLAQAFFAEFLATRLYAGADERLGRFRSYLLTALTRFLMGQQRRGHALKRGGGNTAVSLEPDAFELLALAPDASPERAFELAWALGVLERAVDHLRAEAGAGRKLAMFDRLSEFLGELPDDAGYAAAAEDLGMRRNTIAVAVARLRARLRELVRDELRLTVDSDAEADAEYAVLRRVLGGDG